MSKPIRDGGPAFPLTNDAIAYDNRAFTMQGMTLRDWFAGQALVGYVPSVTCGQWGHNEAAKWCYAIADAMLAARESAHD